MNRHGYNPPIRNFALIMTAVILFAGCAKENPVPAERWVVGGSHNIEGGIIGSTTDGGLTWNFKSGIVEILQQLVYLITTVTAALIRSANDQERSDKRFWPAGSRPRLWSKVHFWEAAGNFLTRI